MVKMVNFVMFFTSIKKKNPGRLKPDVSLLARAKGWHRALFARGSYTAITLVSSNVFTMNLLQQ